MLPGRRSLPPLRLRPRRRHHRRRRPSPRELARRLTRRRARLRSIVALAVAAVAAAIAVSAPPPAAAGPRAPHQPRPSPPAAGYVPPVDAPVVDPFRPPAGRFGAGNRGLEYATTPGSPVRASAEGTVVFAGPVAGSRHVTVLHGDGLRTSYSFLASIEVVRGQQVAQGDTVGTAGDRLHFGARAGDAYIDPAVLFGGSVTELELLPMPSAGAGAATVDAEALALLEVAWREGGGLSVPGVGAALDWLSGRARTGLTYARDLSPLGRGLRAVGDLADRLLFPGPCSTAPPPQRPAAGARRVAVTVAGLGSSSTTGSIDQLRIGDLGYERDRVVRFSYAGGRTPASGAAFPGLRASSYASADTQGDVVAAAERLADLIEDVAAADPGATVDLYAHSLGGVVARLALDLLERRGTALDRLGVVVTFGTPHRGADAATAVAAAASSPLGGLGLDLAERALDTGLDPDAVVVGQLAEHSDVVARLTAAGVPDGVRLVSVAARGDLVVAAPNTGVAGATNVTVPVSGPGAHADLVGSDAATAEVARALAGEPPGCESWGDAVADVLTGHAVSAAEDHAGAIALAVSG